MKGGGVGGSSPRESMDTICPRPPACAPPLSGAPETMTPSDTSMYVGAWGGVAPVCRCVRQTAARKGKEGKGAFRPKAYWLSSRGGPARRHLSTLSAWGESDENGVVIVPSIIALKLVGSAAPVLLLLLATPNFHPRPTLL